MLTSSVVDIWKIAKSFNPISFWSLSRDLNIAEYALAKFCSNFDMDAKYFDSFRD